VLGYNFECGGLNNDWDIEKQAHKTLLYNVIPSQQTTHFARMSAWEGKKGGGKGKEREEKNSANDWDSRTEERGSAWAINAQAYT